VEAVKADSNFEGRRGMHLDPRQVPMSLMRPAMDAGHPAESAAVARCRNCGRGITPTGAAALPAALVGEQTSDHAPIESVYGIVCRTCVGWLDDEGVSEFGIAIPVAWPCGVARAAGVCCADGLVGVDGCNCGSPADATVGYAHEPLCGWEPCPNGCWERLHPDRDAQPSDTHAGGAAGEMGG
jgi:hypothetical protein